MSHDLNGPRRCVRLVRGRVCGKQVAPSSDYCGWCTHMVQQERLREQAQQQGPREVKP